MNPDIWQGKPVFRGLKYPVERILELPGSCRTVEEILEDNEDLEKEDLLACLEFGAKMTQVKDFSRLPHEIHC